MEPQNHSQVCVCVCVSEKDINRRRVVFQTTNPLLTSYGRHIKHTATQTPIDAQQMSHHITHKYNVCIAYHQHVPSPNPSEAAACYSTFSFVRRIRTNRSSVCRKTITLSESGRDRRHVRFLSGLASNQKTVKHFDLGWHVRMVFNTLTCLRMTAGICPFFHLTFHVARHHSIAFVLVWAQAKSAIKWPNWH